MGGFIAGNLAGSGRLVVKVVLKGTFVIRFSLVYILGYRSGFVIGWYRFLVGSGGKSDLG